MTMLETKKEIEIAIANNSPMSFDTLLNAYVAVLSYIDVNCDNDIHMEVSVE